MPRNKEMVLEDTARALASICRGEQARHRPFWPECGMHSEITGETQATELWPPSRNHGPSYKWQSWSKTGNSTVACSGELHEPPGWHCFPVLSCRIRKPIIINMCWESSLAVRVPRGLAEMMWFHFSQWIFISSPCSSLLIVPTFFFLLWEVFSFMSEAF